MITQAIGYVRVSTEGQVNEGVSLEAQQAKIKSWCEAHGYALLGIQVDAGLSGFRTNNRPGLQAALTDVCKNQAALVVYSLSRLARSTKDAILISERLAKSGADLVSLSERIDTTSAAGKMIFRMLAVLAEFERDQISERTRFAMAHKARQHELVGKIPFGLDLAADGRSLIPNPIEQEVIHVMRALRAKSLAYRAIAAQLTARRIPTKEGHAVWHHTAVRRILSHVA